MFRQTAKVYSGKDIVTQSHEACLLLVVLRYIRVCSHCCVTIRRLGGVDARVEQQGVDDSRCFVLYFITTCARYF